jgi:putative FmdB family regulatory protein
MATYEYRCDQDGAFEEARALGTAPESIVCPVCRGEARRVFSPPMLTSTPPALAAAIDHAEKTRHEPDVVTSLPPAPAHKRTPVLPLTPTLRRLPRP